MPAPSDSVRDAHFRQLNAYRDDPAYAALDGDAARAAFFARQVGRRWEIDQAIYDEFLDLLSPLAWRGDSFLLSEFLFGDITHRFVREGDRYFCEVVRYPERPTRQVTAITGPGPQPRR